MVLRPQAIEAQFLSSPSALRTALSRALANASHLDAAVAFVGRDWEDILGDFNGPTRLVCWLSSTNTNPHAIAQMLERGIDVRQCDAMHAKVYLTSGEIPAAVVGSANLSGAALAADDALGQVEAGVLLRSSLQVRATRDWFDDLWQGAHPITEVNIQNAIHAWEAAHRNRARRSGSTTRCGAADSAVASPMPIEWSLPPGFESFVERARKSDPAIELREYQPIVRAMETSASRRDIEALIEHVSRWTGHAGVYYPALNEPTARVRGAFATLFDRTRPPAERLREVAPGGAKKIAGFGLASLSMILSWRYPYAYPPFNRRTQRLLKDLGLSDYVKHSLSPQQYEHWIALAQDLSSRLRLPTAGHVDRLVWYYTEHLEID